MPAQPLDGRALAAQIRQEVRTEIQKTGLRPGLAVILVGSDPASHLYVGLKEKACAEAGIRFEKFLFFATEPQEKIISKIKELNTRRDIHATLVQLPLPPQFNENEVIRAIIPQKDADGFHPANLRALDDGKPAVIPGVALGIMALIKSSGQPIRGRRALLLTNSFTFALPLEYLLRQSGAFVETAVAPPDIETLAGRVGRADIVVSALGRPHCLTGDMLKRGAIVVDVGTSRLPDGTLAGDVEPVSAQQKAGFLTPVPGGVGPMTVAMLLKNTLALAKSVERIPYN